MRVLLAGSWIGIASAAGILTLAANTTPVRVTALGITITAIGIAGRWILKPPAE